MGSLEGDETGGARRLRGDRHGRLKVCSYKIRSRYCVDAVASQLSELQLSELFS